MVACRSCGAPDGISLAEPVREVTCTVCGARQQRADYLRHVASERAHAAEDTDARSYTPRRRVRPWVTFFLLASVGTVVILATARHAALLCAIVGLAGAFVAALGVHAIQNPTSIQIARNQGVDAFGQTQYGPSTQATPAQARRIGRVCLAVGYTIVAIGVVLGWVL